MTDNVIICDLIVGSDAAGPDKKKATLSGLISKYWSKNLDSVGLQLSFKAALCRNV